MAKIATAEQTFRDVLAAAETIRNDEPATVEVIGPGDVVRQGDCYILCLDRPLAGKPTGTRQLVPGTTQGSRHIVEGDCEIVTPERSKAIEALNHLIPATRAHTPFIGPAILATGPVTITHPEHGWRTLPAGNYLVTYQRAWTNEVRRQMD